ncbi:tetratricopeptide repeat protein [Acetobacter conturbans]|uniref:hypothetical protein n=1 Tax=Acetobacter conturbans TaxID=1737472 RepID=UPI00156851AD|nr:hypothetical protein [Acetobacter conturbans]
MVAPAPTVVPPAAASAAQPGAVPAGWQAERIGVRQDEKEQKQQTSLPPAVNAGTAQTTDGNVVAPPVTPPPTQQNTSQPISKIFLPLGDNVGVAGFWSRDDFIIVSDHATQMDTSALAGSDPFSKASVQTLGNTTIVSFHFDRQFPLEMLKQPGGWILAIRPEGEAARSASPAPQMQDGGILYPLPEPGRVVEIADPATGVRLLVATASDEAPGPVLSRHKLGYEIWPSVQGLVFAVEADQIEVRKGNGGAFLDAVGKGGIPVASAAAGDVADDRVDWTWLGLRSLSSATLREDYRRRWTQAAMLPPEQRAEARLSAARAAFSLGDAKGANAILGAAIEDNPELAIQPNVTFLQAVSQLMAGNTDGASALGNSEAGADGVFWRGLYLARSGGDPHKAAALMAQGFSNLKSYPEPLRKKLGPEAATFIARYGNDEDQAVLDPLPPEKDYDLARAFLTLNQGDREKALKMFSHLAADKNPVAAAQGVEQVLTQKLALGQISPADAANGYERLLFAARQAGTEKEVRDALVRALMQAGEWPKALLAVDEKTQRFPEERASTTPQIQDILAHLAGTTGQAPGKPVELVDAVAMIQSHIDQIPDGPVKGQILAGLGAKFQALGLPGKAAMAFEHALPLAGDDASRAGWGAELAQADMDAHRLGQARRALEETQDPGADSTLASRRRVIEASLLAREGSRDQALQLLAQDESEAALDLRGRILEEQRKWPDAVLIVGRLATKQIPESGALNLDQQELTVRLATDAARANDWGTLDRLREWIGGRRMTTERQHVFDLLVTSPQEDLRKRALNQ